MTTDRNDRQSERSGGVAWGWGVKKVRRAAVGGGGGGVVASGLTGGETSQRCWSLLLPT